MDCCEHDNLLMQSGGFFMICADCGVKWIAAKDYGGEIDYERFKSLRSGHLWKHSTPDLNSQMQPEQQA